jgi:hypothetical protein
MTLIVGARTDTAAWIMSDAAITGGTLDIRNREYQLKIVPSIDSRALIGLAGDQHHGQRLMYSASTMPSCSVAIAALREETRQYPSVDIAYAYMEGSAPHLLHISRGDVFEVGTINLGSPDAFERFQRIRHSLQISAVPKSLSILFLGTRCPDPIPPQVRKSVASMFQLFVERHDRDVGGWVLPYILTNSGAFLCGYGYSVSDPIFEEISAGTAVPHGTPERGGFGISLTEFGRGDGLVLYWLQRKHGTIYRRTVDGYEPLQFIGSPNEFLCAAEEKLGKKVEIMLGEKALGRPEKIIVTRDENGQPAMAIAVSGRAVSFAPLNIETEFRSISSINLEPEAYPKDVPMSWGSLKITVADDRKRVTLSFERDGANSGPLEFDAQELSQVVAALGEARTALSPQVSGEPPTKSGTRELVVPDPAWRTTTSIHSDMDGLVLRLRHLGFGWLTFLLPHHEAINLSNWLLKNAKGTKC